MQDNKKPTTQKSQFSDVEKRAQKSSDAHKEKKDHLITRTT
jgi:hypothetical protein